MIFLKNQETDLYISVFSFCFFPAALWQPQPVKIKPEVGMVSFQNKSCTRACVLIHGLDPLKEVADVS